jgi:arginyl-tRNA synthetase
MKKKISEIVKKAVLALQKEKVFPDFYSVKSDEVGAELFNRVEIADTKDEKFGDYTTNVAMILAKIIKKNPVEIAEKLASVIASEAKQSRDKSEIATVATLPRNNNVFKKIEAVKPGYINFYLSEKYLQEKVAEINNLGEKFGSGNVGKDKKVLIDFVSANPTGPIHLGNGRGGPLGDVLANILQKSGYQAEREYYINDWGNQIKVLGHSVLKDDKAEYKGEYVEDLNKKFQKFHDLANKNAYTDEEIMKIGNWAAGEIIENLVKPSCENLGIHFDNWFSEKKLHDKGKVDEAIDLVKKKNLTYEEGGALWYCSSQFGDDKDRVLIKESGEKTYFGVDIAYHRNKLERGFDKLINIWGADHHGDVARVKSIVEEVLGGGNKLDFIVTQLVRIIKDGKEVRMSKRKGVYFAMDDLIEEVGKDAVRFIFLSYAPTSHVNFDIDLAKEHSEKNPVYYVQYAYARIHSILAKVKSEKLKVKSLGDFSLLIHKKELSLIKELNKFPELIQELSETYEVHKLPHYAMRLADKFHSFYDQCQVIDEENPEMTGARLELVKAVKIVLGETLRLMGISAPDRM